MTTSKRPCRRAVSLRHLYGRRSGDPSQIPPIIQSVARFGLSHLAVPLGTVPPRPVTGLLAGIVMAFDGGRAANQAATYQVCIDDRMFRFAIRDGHLAEARGEPQVRLTASASDLVVLRLSPDPHTRSAAASHPRRPARARRRLRRPDRSHRHCRARRRPGLSDDARTGQLTVRRRAGRTRARAPPVDGALADPLDPRAASNHHERPSDERWRKVTSATALATGPTTVRRPPPRLRDVETSTRVRFRRLNPSR
jgi:hypothetical protein